MDHVGTGSFGNHMARPNRWLKRYGLFFDRFEIVDLDECLEHHRESGYGKIDTIEECDWLIEQGMLSEPNDMETAPYLAPDLSPAVQAIDRELRALRMKDQPLGKAYHESIRSDGHVPLEMIPVIDQRNAIWGDIRSLQARRSAIVMREGGLAVATSLEDPPEALPASVDQPVSQQDLFRFVMTDVPVPSGRVPWRDIVDFKADPDSAARLRDLRLWIATTARGGLSAAEASDRIRASLEDYRRHVRALGIERERAQWEALLITNSATRGELLSRWIEGSAAQPVKLFRSSATFLKAERHAPGRELSYIVKIEDAAL